MAVGLIFYFYMTDMISIGQLGMALSSFMMIIAYITKVFSFAGEIASTVIMSKPFFDFIDIQTEAKPAVSRIDKIDSIVFKHVGYRYPGSESMAVSDINVKIKKGESVAIVGLNGAGKTTLGKILMGLLIPTSGDMYINGINRRDITERELTALYSAVFQQYGKYMLGVYENIILSDYNQYAINPERVTAALSWAGLGFLRDKNVMLGTVFGGTDLSGGQWQRLALARGYFRNRDNMIMDEPTAAIDPLEEVSLLKRLKLLSEGKTTTLITHRLGAIRFCDHILVLENGSITESGTFGELMEKQGMLYNLWHQHVKLYKTI